VPVAGRDVTKSGKPPTGKAAGQVRWALDMTSGTRLRDLLASIFPALEAAFDYSTRSALVLLTGSQTPTGIPDAGAGELAEHLRTGGVSGRSAASRRWGPSPLPDLSRLPGDRRPHRREVLAMGMLWIGKHAEHPDDHGTAMPGAARDLGQERHSGHGRRVDAALMENAAVQIRDGA
jgi:hypothetical protein